MKRSEKLLLVSDDAIFVKPIKNYLTQEGFEVQVSGRGDEKIKSHLKTEYALIMIDSTPTDLCTMKICRQMWATCRDTPIIILSDQKVEQDCVRCLEAGCDDYITKSSGARELSARIKTVLRRCNYAQQGAKGKTAGRQIKVNGMVIDPEKRQIILKDKPVNLTAKEYDLLYLFASNPGRVYSRRQLLDIIWDFHDDVYEHTVNSHINRLRKKIEKTPHSPQFILTVWGIGYRFTDPKPGR
ncbi:MAG: response regulator transcription factor [Candidatus Krumholzibacteriota bacterium]|nr:response regulator transcription factor [Candidatus Krumholzibacteriota bacterium]